MPLPRTYDPYIERHRGPIHPSFVRALIRGESNFKPGATTGSYRGLMQVGPSVLKDYNARHNTGYTADNLFDPDTNVKIGCGAMNRWLESYKAYAALRMDWTSIRYAELVMFGWNAGHSRAAGVQYVVGMLESKGLRPADITIDAVSKAASDGTAPKASGHLANIAKVAYCKKVARWFAEDAAIPYTPSNPSSLTLADLFSGGTTGQKAKATMAIVAGIGILLL